MMPATNTSTNVGRFLIEGEACSDVAFSSLPLSFMMGVDAKTGVVIDQSHPLLGICLAGKVVVLPHGRGSCSGSGVILELLLENAAPAALIFSHLEEILTLGVLICRILFKKSIPVILLSDAHVFSLLEHAKNVRIFGHEIHIDSNHFTLASSKENELTLSEEDKRMLRGENCSTATQTAMETVASFAEIQGAKSLINVSQVHIDACCYVGKSSVLIPQTLHNQGGKFLVPSTCNSLNIDIQRWKQMGVHADIGSINSKIAELYLAMGSKMSFTCAPYLLDSKPQSGEQIGWGESNAVVFANSVLGARTQKYPDYLDVMIALTGRAPYTGAHLSSGRLPKLSITVPELSGYDQSVFPLLGYHIGGMVGSKIPCIFGLEASKATVPNLKDFSAAFATTSSAPMFHMNGITPESHDLQLDPNLRQLIIGVEDLQRTWRQLNTAETKKIDLVSLGNPHLAFEEFVELADLCRDRVKAKDCAMVITTNRHVYSQAAKHGQLNILEKFGAQIITDTCWCMIDEPVISTHISTIMTNSAKYAHYGPGLTNRKYHFGSLASCVAAACKGWRDETDISPSWLFKPNQIQN